MKIALNKISTENRNKKSFNIDKASSLEIVRIINNEDKKVVKAVKSQSYQIAQAIDMCYQTIQNKGRIIYIGAGTSGRLGVLDASEMPPTYGVDSSLFVAIQAGGDFAIRNAVENAEDDEKQAIVDLKKNRLDSKDILIGLSASGRTPYVKSAINFANSIGCKTIAIATSFNSEIGLISTLKIEPVTGAEVVTGSTRMKSGTAQKMVLNMISTGVMIKVGKIYSNLMVDLKCTNEKLKSRAINIVKEITNANDAEIEDLLNKNQYDVKNAIVCLKKRISIEEANKLLQENNFILAKTI